MPHANTDTGPELHLGANIRTVKQTDRPQTEASKIRDGPLCRLGAPRQLGEAGTPCWKRTNDHATLCLFLVSGCCCCCCLLISCVTGTNINLIPRLRCECGCAWACVRTANPIRILIPTPIANPMAALPNAVSNCTVFNRTELSVDIQCIPGYDGGLPQIFVLEMFSTRTGITR